MSKLSYKQRTDLPSRSFVFKKTRKFPIEDANHARNALSRATSEGSEVESKVKSAVKRKFPSITQE